MEIRYQLISPFFKLIAQCFNFNVDKILFFLNIEEIFNFIIYCVLNVLNTHKPDIYILNIHCLTIFFHAFKYRKNIHFF